MTEAVRATFLKFKTVSLCRDVIAGAVRTQGFKNENHRQSNEYFSAALIGTVVLAAVTWLGLIFFDRELLTAFGSICFLVFYTPSNYIFPSKLDKYMEIKAQCLIQFNAA